MLIWQILFAKKQKENLALIYAVKLTGGLGEATEMCFSQLLIIEKQNHQFCSMQ